MMRIPAERTLDLGTGGGYLAMLAAAHSRHVLGTDVNARAIAMARFNAQLNGIGNIELAAGDLYEPAGERRFDLILSNPPFVVSPEGGVMFRDSGLLGDEICERIIRGAPAHLAEGGFAQVLCNWVRLAGRDWVERLTGWFEDSGCDVWVIQALSFDPADYAQHWLGQADAPGQGAVRRALRPLDGLLRPAGDRGDRLRADQPAAAVDGAELDPVRRRPPAQPAQWHGDPRRLRGASTWSGGSRMCRRGCRCGSDAAPSCGSRSGSSPAQSGWKVEKAECVLGDGLRFEGEVDPVVFHLLTLCRGREPLSEILPQVAARVGRDPEEVLPAGLRAARELVEQGFLWPVDLPLEPPGLTRPVTGIGDGHASG